MPILDKPLVIAVYLPAGLEDISDGEWIAFKSDKGLVFDFMARNAEGARYAIIHDIAIPPPPVPIPPTPITYATYHALQNMNLRPQPTTQMTAVGSAHKNDNLELSTEMVTPDFLARLGKPTYTIEAGYEWRHIKDDKPEDSFIASKIGTIHTVASGVYIPPSTPPNTTNPNLKALNVGGKWRIAIQGTTRPVEAMVNMRSLAFCGLPRVNGTSYNDIPRHLDAAKSAGARVVRVYTACEDLTDSQCADRVQFVLDELGKRGMLGILTLNDSLASGFHVKGDEQDRNYEHGHLTYQFYHAKGYLGADFTHAETILTRVGNHSAIGAVDICNETGGYGRPDRSIPAADTAAIRQYGLEKIALIRSLCPQWIVWELISSAHVGCDTPVKTENFYRGLGLNAMCTHLYREQEGGWVTEQRALVDSQVAKKLGMVLYIGEFGAWYFGGSRKPELEGAIGRYQAWAGAFSFWGFNGVSASMNFSDNLGASIHLPDYPDVLGLIRSYS